MKNSKIKNVICKFPLKIIDVQDIELPTGSVLLSVQSQNNTPCLWVLICNQEAEKEVIRLRTIGTGISISYDDFDWQDFLGTYQLNDGSFVGHVFQIIMP